MKTILMGIIRLYQMTLSRALPPTCRFTPSCSQYSFEAIDRYGALRGGWMAVKRISRCHPFNPGGYDPVPDLEEDKVNDLILTFFFIILHPFHNGDINWILVFGSRS